uniref:Uncharacterized protein n=1 Tax=Acrobeloides nanus TaxID=290746 RepID=A0A914DH20_9BILA
MNSPLCLNGTSDFSCNKIVVIGINQTNADLFDLGNWIFLTSFDDYTLKTVDKFECGNGYCDESMCTGQENGCYNYLACIDEQCIYW